MICVNTESVLFTSWCRTSCSHVCCLASLSCLSLCGCRRGTDSSVCYLLTLHLLQLLVIAPREESSHPLRLRRHYDRIPVAKSAHLKETGWDDESLQPFSSGCCWTGFFWMMRKGLCWVFVSHPALENPHPKGDPSRYHHVPSIGCNNQ